MSKKNITNITSVPFIETEGPSVAIGTKSKEKFFQDLKLLGVSRVITLLSDFDQPGFEEERCLDMGLEWLSIITEPFYTDDTRKTELYEQGISAALRNMKRSDRIYIHIANGNTDPSDKNTCTEG